MRVCLVSSINLSNWFKQESEPTVLSLPLGILSIAAVLEKDGHSVVIFDFNYALSKGSVIADQSFYDCAAQKIVESKPDLIGFSTMCNSYHMALRIAEKLKIKMPQIPIIFGGPQASVVDVETLQSFIFVDFVVRGEAEEIFPQLVSALMNGKQFEHIDGLTYRKRDGIVKSPDAALLADLNSLPIPAYHLFPFKIENPVAIDIGRGCPYNCSFCSTSKFWKQHFRLKSIDRIIQEIKILTSTYQVTSFSFMHDLFTVNRKWLQEFCDRLINEKMNITWTCSARIDCITPDLLQVMAQSGCLSIFYGIETGSPRMQRIIKKNLILKNVHKIVDATINSKMGATMSFIAGFPEETEEDLVQTLEFIQTLISKDVNIQLHLLAPQVGTLEYDLHSKELRFDGYFSDIAGINSQFLEQEWFEKYPKLFASYYYFENKQLPRDLLKGLDVFMQGPMSIMRGTMLRLLRTYGSLHRLYIGWHSWAKNRNLDRSLSRERVVDQLLMDFYEFVEAQVKLRNANSDLGHSRDEILAFYLRQYHNTPVQFVSIDETNKTQEKNQEDE